MTWRLKFVHYHLCGVSMCGDRGWYYNKSNFDSRTHGGNLRGRYVGMKLIEKCNLDDNNCYRKQGISNIISNRYFEVTISHAI